MADSNAAPAGGAGDPPAATPAGRFRGFAIALVLVASLVALDQWSKAAVFERLGMPGQTPLVEGQVRDCHPYHLRMPLVGGWLALMTSLNTGAAWGVGKDHPEILVFGRIGAGLLLLFLLWRAQPSHRAYWLALTLVLAGATGNLIDNLWLGPDLGDGRSFRPVRDFIDVYFVRWEYHFPTFNVADSCITTGAVLLLLSGLVRHREPEG